MCQCCPQIETNQLICCANQFTGFYMRATLALNGLISRKKIWQINKQSVFELINNTNMIVIIQ